MHHELDLPWLDALDERLATFLITAERVLKTISLEPEQLSVTSTGTFCSFITPYE